MNKQRSGSLLIIIAGIFWATMGIFVRALAACGFDSIQISAFRLLSAALCFILILLAKSKAGLKIRPKDIPLFLSLGIGSVAIMTCCYFSAIGMLDLSTAAILLYTSPIWVMLMSIFLFHERVTQRKIIALACAFGGCVLVSGVGGGSINAAGLAVGVISGVAYGLYSIFGNILLRRYSPFTVTAYGFSIAALAVFALSRPQEMLSIIAASGSKGVLALLVLATGIVTAVIPYLLYTIGLKSVEPSRAAILATSEPMMATVLGAIVYGEAMKAASAVGVLGILAAIILLNSGKREIP